jgi:hypothetical protein
MPGDYRRYTGIQQTNGKPFAGATPLRLAREEVTAGRAAALLLAPEGAASTGAPVVLDQGWTAR